MTATEHKSDFKFTGELWGVCYENFEENWSRYNGTALYVHCFYEGLRAADIYKIILWSAYAFKKGL